MTDQHVTDELPPTSERNEKLWASLRRKGYRIDIRVSQVMHVAVNGVEMPFGDARALDRGFVTLDEIARHCSARRQS